MATIRLHGNKALIIQHFNDLPDVLLMEFNKNIKHYYKKENKPKDPIESWRNRLLKNNHILTEEENDV